MLLPCSPLDLEGHGSREGGAQEVGSLSSHPHWLRSGWHGSGMALGLLTWKGEVPEQGMFVDGFAGLVFTHIVRETGLQD